MNKEDLKLIEERLLIGEKKYGSENVATDGRDFVKESLEDTIIFEKRLKDGGALDAGKKFLDATNRFMKIRFTVVALAFHARNAVSNVFSQLLDTNLSTLSAGVQFDASRLNSLSGIYDTYGSIENARRVYNLPKMSTEGAFEYRKRRAKLKILD